MNASNVTISTEIFRQLELYRENERFDNAIITICDIATMLQIRDENMSWWFRVPGDRIPSP